MAEGGPIAQDRLRSFIERIERLEQLRWLQAGHTIRVLEAPEPSPPGVDTPDDLARVEQRLQQESAPHPPGSPDA